MEPLRIEFKLVGPWSPPAYGVHFDGLIAHAVVRDALRTASVSAPGEERQYDHLICDLPFEKYESEAGWCWKASKLQVIGFHGQQRRYLTAKTPVNDMARAIGDGIVEAKGGSIIDTVRGIGKNAALYYTLEHAEELHAWCIGDKEALESLLLEIDGIGVKTRLGHGALAPFEDGRLFRVVADESATTRWKNRNAPDKLEDTMYPGIGSTHSPYWTNKSYCWMPCQA